MAVESQERDSAERNQGSLQSGGKIVASERRCKNSLGGKGERTFQAMHPMPAVVWRRERARCLAEMLGSLLGRLERLAAARL